MKENLKIKFMESKYIKNANELIKANSDREKALAIIEAGYLALDTNTIIKKNVILQDEFLKIKDKTFKINEYSNIYFIGFGKLACQAAEALEQVLGPLIKQGVAIGMTETLCQVIDVHTGTHPTPSAPNIKATEKIINLAEGLTEDDLVIVMVSGGGSALLCADEEEATQGKKLYEEFLSTGGNIYELNTIRKHISSLKGGGLAKLLYPAEVVGLIFSDIPGDQYDLVASGPTHKDTSSIDEAREIITKYNLSHFNLNETPKEDKYFAQVTNIPLAGSSIALEAMALAGEKFGLTTKILNDSLTENPEKVSTRLQVEMAEVNLVLAGGEISIPVPKNNSGQGGRCTTLALQMVNDLKEGQTFVAFASDGYDNTPAAGAIIDKQTKEKIKEKNLDPADYLKRLDAYNFFKQTEDLLITDRIESNVSDLIFLIDKKI